MRMSNPIARMVLVKTVVALAMLAGMGGACVGDEVPPCPGQCFAFTLEVSEPVACQDAEAYTYFIAFTDHATEGYRGRTCFNSTSVPLVVEAIGHLRAGGQLLELSEEVIGAYVTTANTVRADLEAECILAAPGQCINAAQVCSVVGAQAYQQLVIDETCVLGLDGTEPVTLEPGQVCEPVVGDGGTGSDGAEAQCVEATVGGDEGLDGTASSGLADDTTG